MKRRLDPRDANRFFSARMNPFPTLRAILAEDTIRQQAVWRVEPLPADLMANVPKPTIIMHPLGNVPMPSRPIPSNIGVADQFLANQRLDDHWPATFMLVAPPHTPSIVGIEQLEDLDAVSSNCASRHGESSGAKNKDMTAGWSQYKHRAGTDWTV